MTEFKNPLFTVDSVLITVSEKEICVLLVKRAIEPFAGSWSLPGGFVDLDKDKSTESTALRKLSEKTGVEPPFLEQLKSFSGQKRDPRGWSVTQAYWALMSKQAAAAKIDTVEDAEWFPLSKLITMKLAFDHHQIIYEALVRMRNKALYSMIPVYCLPEEFKMSEFREVLEVLLGTTVQKRTLYRRVESSGAFEEIEKKSKSIGRDATLYRVRKGAESITFDRNISA